MDVLNDLLMAHLIEGASVSETNQIKFTRLVRFVLIVLIVSR